jgi:hypothetical protein
MATLTRVLGPASPDGAHGNFEFLDTLMASVAMAGTGGGRTSEGTYFGLSSLPATAESDAHLKGAWVAISPDYVSLMERVAAISIAFPHVLKQVFAVEQELGEYDALEMLGNIRSSAFHYWEALWHEADPEFDTPEVWDQFLATQECLAITRGAIAFTLCHEMAHLTQGDSSSRPDRRLLAERLTHASDIPPSLWPEEAAHRAELIADWAAVDHLSRVATFPEPLGVRMVGSMVATIAMAIDGWNQDQAALSITHPSPFLRLECLLAYWSKALSHGREIGWGQMRRPTPLDLELFAQVWGMGGWAAGRYRDGRDGLGLFNDINEAWGFALRASGHEGLFVNSHSK